MLGLGLQKLGRKRRDLQLETKTFQTSSQHLVCWRTGGATQRNFGGGEKKLFRLQKNALNRGVGGELDIYLNLGEFWFRRSDQSGGTEDGKGLGRARSKSEVVRK